MRKLVCKTCGNEFEFRPGKPGLINECWNCATEAVEKKAGVMIWEHKHAPELMICSKKLADEYRRKNRRVGATVCSGCGKPPQGFAELNESKSYKGGSEKEPFYTTRLGEKRKVKR